MDHRLLTEEEKINLSKTISYFTSDVLNFKMNSKITISFKIDDKGYPVSIEYQEELLEDSVAQIETNVY